MKANLNSCNIDVSNCLWQSSLDIPVHTRHERLWSQQSSCDPGKEREEETALRFCGFIFMQHLWPLLCVTNWSSFPHEFYCSWVLGWAWSSRRKGHEWKLVQEAHTSNGIRNQPNNNYFFVLLILQFVQFLSKVCVSNTCCYLCFVFLPFVPSYCFLLFVLLLFLLLFSFYFFHCNLLDLLLWIKRCCKYY